MSGAPMKISDSSLKQINEQLIKQRQENQETINDGSIRKQEESFDSNSEDSVNVDNNLVFLRDDVDYKIYKFNGKLERDEYYLGQNFDVIT